MAITKEGESQDFNYTGNVQSFTAPVDGIYKLEVWGAKGGRSVGHLTPCPYDGGNGGYSVGYTVLNKGDILYVVCGGAGDTGYGGYNGGAAGGSDYGQPQGGGGGATHIATVSGLLPSLSSQKSSVLLCAGGGGGSFRARMDSNYSCPGGYGGGYPTSYTDTGVSDKDDDGVLNDYDTFTNYVGGGSFGQGENTNPSGSLICGGGGGWEGGKAGFNGGYCGAAGGSGYIGGVPAITYKKTTYSPSMSYNVNGGNGVSKITLIKKAMPATLYLGGLELTGIFVGNNEIKSAFLGNKDLG